MPLVNCDVKGLEVVAAAQLSGDKVLRQEILEFHSGERELDVHGQNQKDFNLPSRLIAKTFKFRLIYGGSAYSYAHDPDFMGVSTSQKFWQNVIDMYYTKYYGIETWHRKLILEAQSTGRLGIPSGRYYPISPDYKKSEPWPITIIKNYPVQGFGADLVMLARLRAHQLIGESGLEALPVCTVHDSLVYDTPSENTRRVGVYLKQAVEDVPRLCRSTWGYDFSLPLTAEVTAGKNKADMLDIGV